MIIYSDTIIRLIGWGSGRVEGVTFYPFIILREDLRGTSTADYVINHEKIHIAQQMELLLIFFMAIYFYEYFAGRIRGLTPGEAYRNIRFEREAYYHMYDLRYPGRRKLFAYRKKWGDSYV